MVTEGAGREGLAYTFDRYRHGASVESFDSGTTHGALDNRISAEYTYSGAPEE